MRFPLRTYRAGDTVLAEGQKGEMLYIVRSGRLQATRLAGDHRIVLGEIGEGEIVGEMSIFSPDHTRSATVRAIADSELVEISAEDFKAILSKTPPIVTAVIRAAVQRLRGMDIALSRAGTAPEDMMRRKELFVTATALASAFQVPVERVIESLDMVPPEEIYLNRDATVELVRALEEIGGR